VAVELNNMDVMKLAVTLLLSVFLEAQRSFAHCPFDNGKRQPAYYYFC